VQTKPVGKHGLQHLLVSWKQQAWLMQWCHDI